MTTIKIELGRDTISAPKFSDMFRLAEKGDRNLDHRHVDLMKAESQTKKITNYIRRSVKVFVRLRDTVTELLKEALGLAIKAGRIMLEFAKEHPVFVTIIAIGVMVIVAPWVIEALGFGELGPIADTFASWWQARYAGYVPKGSLFSFLQWLGMTWK
ncbi:hypothetical protein BDP67DRAFT_611129 [Colletotrichum lupini]|nr:hypothetical protein BDP67DRAFT_611129 [Colletotrichum lupini]